MAILSGVPVERVVETVQKIIGEAKAGKVLVSLDEKWMFTIEKR